MGDPHSANNSATDTDTITIASDVAVTKTGPTTVVPGTTVEYTIVVTNNGPSVATDILVGDIMFGPGGVVEFPEFLAGVVSPPGIECPEHARKGWTLLRAGIHDTDLHHPIAGAAREPDASRGASRFPRTFQAVPIHRRRRWRTWSMRSCSPAVDSDLSNNFAVVDDRRNPAGRHSRHQDGTGRRGCGHRLQLFRHGVNNGPSTATNVVVEDPTPAGLTFVGGSGPCASRLPLHDRHAGAGEGQTTRIDLFVPFDYAGPTTFVNTASASSPSARSCAWQQFGSRVDAGQSPGKPTSSFRKSGPSGRFARSDLSNTSSS